MRLNSLGQDGQIETGAEVRQFRTMPDIASLQSDVMTIFGLVDKMALQKIEGLKYVGNPLLIENVGKLEILNAEIARVLAFITHVVESSADLTRTLGALSTDEKEAVLGILADLGEEAIEAELVLKSASFDRTKMEIQLRRFEANVSILASANQMGTLERRVMDTAENYFDMPDLVVRFLLMQMVELNDGYTDKQEMLRWLEDNRQELVDIVRKSKPGDSERKADLKRIELIAKKARDWVVRNME